MAGISEFEKQINDFIKDELVQYTGVGLYARSDRAVHEVCSCLGIDDGKLRSRLLRGSTYRWKLEEIVALTGLFGFKFFIADGDLYIHTGGKEIDNLYLQRASDGAWYVGTRDVQSGNNGGNARKSTEQSGISLEKGEQPASIS